MSLYIVAGASVFAAIIFVANRNAPVKDKESSPSAEDVMRAAHEGNKTVNLAVPNTGAEVFNPMLLRPEFDVRTLVLKDPKEGVPQFKTQLQSEGMDPRTVNVNKMAPGAVSVISTRPQPPERSTVTELRYKMNALDGLSRLARIKK